MTFIAGVWQKKSAQITVDRFLGSPTGFFDHSTYFHSCIELINPPTSEASGLSSRMSVASFSTDGHPISSFRDSAQTKVCSIAQTNTSP
jgi:hypothetical protein